MGLFGRRDKRPRNLFDRIGEASALIVSSMRSKGLCKQDIDIDYYMWESVGYVSAALVAADIVENAVALRIAEKVSGLYPAGDLRREDSLSWIMRAQIFYRMEVSSMLSGARKTPDVIVYNLENPARSRKRFNELPIEGMDAIGMMSVWAAIADIMGDYFFRKGENIKALPLGL